MPPLPGHGEAYRKYLAQTSNLPFLAILTRRNRLQLGELGWGRLVLGLAVFVGLLLLHPYAFGASPLPSGPVLL